MIKDNKKNIARIMFFYWILVIVWQTIRPVANRSVVDSLVKVLLFSIVIIYANRHKDTRNSGNIQSCFVFFVMTQLITVIADVFTMGTFITVVFMFAEIVIFMIWMRNETISEDELINFGKLIIIVGIIMAAYNVLFNTTRFLWLFGGGSDSYGHECKSFLYSNHEFAVYLSAAIIFTVWFRIKRKIKTVPAVLIVAFLGINQLSTYSRTATLGVIVAITILCLFAGARYFTTVLITYVGAGIFISKNSFARSILFNKLLKNSFENSGGIVDVGRAEMYSNEWEYFKNGSFFEILFGHGYTGNSAGGHNGYLVILNTGGVIMFVFFMVVIFFGIKQALNCIKYDKTIGSLLLSLESFALLYMVAQTPILFYSSMDSYFITMLAVLIPMYVNNYFISKVNSDFRIIEH